MPAATARLLLPGRPALAVRHRPGRAPAVLFLPGLASTMAGIKAEHVERHCAALGHGFAALDYRGHGGSEGRFEDGCVADWLEDALAVIDQVAAGPLVLVGSSLGAWLAILLALRRPDRMAGIVGIAAAPDATADLIAPALDPARRRQLAASGICYLPSRYGPPLPITRRLLEDGERHLVLRGPLPIRAPVHLLHGQADLDVPWRTSLALAGRLESDAVTVELVADGDHRLSRPQDLRRVTAALDRVLTLVEP